MKGMLKILTLAMLAGITLGDCVPTLPPNPAAASAPAAPLAPTAARVG